MRFDFRPSWGFCLLASSVRTLHMSLTPSLNGFCHGLCLKLQFEVGRHSSLSPGLGATSQWFLLCRGLNRYSHQVESVHSSSQAGLGSTWEWGSSIPPSHKNYVQTLPNVPRGKKHTADWEPLHYNTQQRVMAAWSVMGCLGFWFDQRKLFSMEVQFWISVWYNSMRESTSYFFGVNLNLKVLSFF